MKSLVSKEIYNKLDHAKSIVSASPDESFRISKKAYIVARDNKLPLEEAHSLVGMSLAMRIKTDISGMLDCSYRALQIFKDENHAIGEIRALNHIGIAYFYNSMYEEAMKSFIKTIDLLETNKDDFLFSSVLNNIGEIYKESAVYDKAIEYYMKAIDIVISNDFQLSHGAILSNIGEIYSAQKEFQRALVVYQESYNIFISNNDMLNLGEVENKIGKVYFEIGDFKSAKKYYFKSLKILEGINNKYYSIDVLINIGELYLEQSSGRKTLNFYEKAMEYAEEIGAKKKLYQIYNLISQYHEIQGDYKNALEYYKKFFNMNEQISGTNLKTKLEILNIEVINIEETGKLEKLKDRLEKEISRQNSELENINYKNEILEKEANEDELTGICNRRSINTYLKSTLEETHLEEDNIVLFMMDIDRFKRYNDYWGHPKGDVCLKKITDCIKKIQEDGNDVFGRYGGEEFVYIVKNISYDDAFKLGNRIRTEVEKIGLYYIYEGKKEIATISMGGIIGKYSDFDSMEEMLELADQELYRGKDRGRNITILKQKN